MPRSRGQSDHERASHGNRPCCTHPNGAPLQSPLGGFGARSGWSLVTRDPGFRHPVRAKVRGRLRWGSILACAAAWAVASTMLKLPGARGSDGDVPPSHGVGSPVWPGELDERCVTFLFVGDASAVDV